MARPLFIASDAVALLLVAAVLSLGAGRSLFLLPVVVVGLRALLGGYDHDAGGPWTVMSAVFAAAGGAVCVALAVITEGPAPVELVLLWPAALLALAVAQITTRTASERAAPAARCSVRRNP